MEEIVCNGDDLILHAMFDLKPMNGLEYGGDVKVFGSARNGSSSSF